MANFLQTIRTKTQEAFTWLRAKAQTIYDHIERWVRRIRQHQQYINEVLESTPTYTQEEPDVKLIEDLKNCLNELTPVDIVEYLDRLSPDERGQFIEFKLLPEIASAMNISYNELEWFQAERGYCGFYRHSQKKIALNIAYLYTDNRKLLTILVNTIIHECKHARQWAAVEGVDYGYSVELIEEWRRNFVDYISDTESDEGYAKQPVEFDASQFANSIVDENIIFEN